MKDIMEGISPLPWKGGRDIDNLTGYSIWDMDGDFVADSTPRDTAYIVHAANMYPELVKALDGLMKYGHPDWPECQQAMSALAKCKAGVE